jgi:hypothetical protein
MICDREAGRIIVASDDINIRDDFIGRNQHSRHPGLDSGI